MGGSGGGFNSDLNQREFRKKLEETTSVEEKQKYENEVAERFANVLGKYNSRDTEAINTHLQQIKAALGKDIEEGEIRTNLGGSLSRRTHLNGISDVDVLVILNDTELSSLTPAELLEYFRKRLKERFPNTEIKQGDTAVTVSFNDVEIQLLPALKFKSGVKIPDAGEWSEIVKPKEFAQSLTALNEKFSKRLIPSIKLAKGILYKLPEKHRLTGYHIESLANDIFGSIPPAILTNKEILKIFFAESAKRIKEPITDLSGQSKTVDDYLGGKDSLKRGIVANYLQRISNKMSYADDTCAQTNWDEILDI